LTFAVPQQGAQPTGLAQVRGQLGQAVRRGGAEVMSAPRPAEAVRPPWGSSKVAKPHLLVRVVHRAVQGDAEVDVALQQLQHADEAADAQVR
jgi:hypothetical protein